MSSEKSENKICQNCHKDFTIVFLHGLVGSKNNFEYFEKEFPDYQTISFDFIGFGREIKPKINYTLDVYMEFLDKKLQLSKNNNMRYILVGHSLGALLAKEMAKKYPDKIIEIFLMGYPFLEKNKVLGNRRFFDGRYVEGVWWTKIMCETRIIWKILSSPFIFLFGYKYHKSYLDYFNHTYQSAYGTIHNVILNDNKEDLFKISHKIVFINGQKDGSADLEFTKKFKHYFIESMGHSFFNYENEIAKIIKDEINLTNSIY
jgi:pimeloyl-ACP methyl ester carboxylesterase